MGWLNSKYGAVAIGDDEFLAAGFDFEENPQYVGLQFAS